MIVKAGRGKDYEKSQGMLKWVHIYGMGATENMGNREDIENTGDVVANQTKIVL
jgi:hypothetical protein